MSRYEVFEAPAAQAKYADAAGEFLTAIVTTVYPALRQDPTNTTGWFPIDFDQGDYVYTLETPAGGLYHLLYQVIPEPPRVLVFDLVTWREPEKR